MFRLTGMSEEKARFQVISLLTNSGFTTSESELILRSRKRRSIAKVIMIFGYTFTATIVSGVISIIVTYNFKNDKLSIVEIITLSIMFIIFYFLRKFVFIRFIFNRFSEKLYRYFVAKDNINSLMVIENFGNNIIAQVFLNQVPLPLRGKTLAEVDIKNKDNLLVLTITSGENKICSVTADTILEKDSTITVMGKKKDIKKILCP
ncbi:MAG: TrkA C-terminal domain-containing protein [Fusobacterium sp. JB021]|nr:TrkA C-terminal domain-containing protein [Fusobacterium sp. JB020]MDP0493034.1 TrkA C-terminal domain-containing protein [Fusobacterium sp. JB021]MDP0505785.1 TrkA C-terminal domain-containing protein [Fusobacterium sp. JB019]